MRRLLAYIIYWPGYFLLVLSERIQGEGDGLWNDATCFDGNQFCDQVRFWPDD